MQHLGYAACFALASGVAMIAAPIASVLCGNAAGIRRHPPEFPVAQP